MANGLSREVDGIHISRGEGPDVGQVEEEGSAVGGPESALGIFPHRAHTKAEAFYMVSFVGESEKEDLVKVEAMTNSTSGSDEMLHPRREQGNNL